MYDLFLHRLCHEVSLRASNQPFQPSYHAQTGVRAQHSSTCIAVMQILHSATNEIRKPMLHSQTCHLNMSRMTCLSRFKCRIIFHIITTGLQDYQHLG